MVALKPSAPYGHLVPSFPILTQDHSIDYGKDIHYLQSNDNNQ
jgi:hypothetical protein